MSLAPLINSFEFVDTTGWSTTGDVSFANGAATLTETATTQTRLNQVFVLGENDRFLFFTVANAALGDQANGPDDAFEVALIDANTGLSLLGGTGLTHNDAILNRQADGTEQRAASPEGGDASGISVVNNADAPKEVPLGCGSRTYLVDLAGIAAGTVVNLAFDLIGFGQGLAAQNSRLTYTPEANWNGTDRFSYALKEVPLGDKLSDGYVDSNVANVMLTGKLSLAPFR